MEQESLRNLETCIVDSSTVKQLRASFELQLQSSGCASIKAWLEMVPVAERSNLFCELLDAELSFLQQHGREPLAEEYLTRFPDLQQEIGRVFESHALKRPQCLSDRPTDSTIEMALPATSRLGEWTKWGIGDLVGRYRLERFLGRGAFGEVWKAFDPELKRPVAIKLPRKEVIDRIELASQFRDEARRAASLKEQGIVPVYDIGQVGAATFIVSEWIDGPTLAERMRKGPISRDEGVRIIAHLARSLHKAHLAGLVHRDMKPSNVLLRPDGTPAITDFGLAISEDEQLSTESAVVGTLAFMSPEQARGEGRLVDGRSDLYSLGIMLFQLLTGRLPFQYKTSNDLLYQIIHREVRPLRSIDDTIPVELERICLCCLAKDIRQRYSTGSDLANDLQKSISPERPKSHRRQPVVATLIVSLALLVGVGLYAFRSNNRDPAVSLPGSPNAAPDQRGKWLELLGEPLEMTAALKGDATDFLQLDAAKRVLTLRSERNLWVLAASHRGRGPLRIRGSVFVDEWLGSAGFFWGLSTDPDSFPKKGPQCFAILLERYDPNEPVKLCLKKLSIDEFLQDTAWVNDFETLAETSLKDPVNGFQALEVVVRETGVEVRIDGAVVWKRESLDLNTIQECVSADGAVGVVGRGKTVVVREAAVMFQDLEKRANE